LQPIVDNPDRFLVKVEKGITGDVLTTGASVTDVWEIITGVVVEVAVLLVDVKVLMVRPLPPTESLLSDT